MKIERRYFLRRGINAIVGNAPGSDAMRPYLHSLRESENESWGIIEVFVKTSKDLLKLVKIHNDQTA